MNNKIIVWLSRMKTSNLIMIPVILSLIPLGLDQWISGGHYSGTTVEDALILSAVFLWGCVGIPIIVRRESPGLITLYGWPAILSGIFIILCFWIFDASILFFMLKKQ